MNKSTIGVRFHHVPHKLKTLYILLAIQKISNMKLFFRTITLLFLISIICQNTYSQGFNYLPAPVEAHQIITYSQFTLSYNEEHEQAEWVAYELTKQEVAM